MDGRHQSLKTNFSKNKPPELTSGLFYFCHAAELSDLAIDGKMMVLFYKNIEATVKKDAITITIEQMMENHF